MPRRIILNNYNSLTGAIEEIRYELSRINQVVGTGIATQEATAVGSIGVSQLASREDHKHPYQIAPDTLIAPISFTTSTAGVSATFPRGDHQHFANFGPGSQISDVAWSTSTAGNTNQIARADHVHRLKPGVNNSVTGSRTTSVFYTNLGSGPMWIGISASMSAPAADGMHLIVNGIHVAHVDANADVHQFLMGVADPGDSYLLTCSGGANIFHWVEYSF